MSFLRLSSWALILDCLLVVCLLMFVISVVRLSVESSFFFFKRSDLSVKTFYVHKLLPISLNIMHVNEYIFSHEWSYVGNMICEYSRLPFSNLFLTDRVLSGPIQWQPSCSTCSTHLLGAKYSNSICRIVWAAWQKGINPNCPLYLRCLWWLDFRK